MKPKICAVITSNDPAGVRSVGPLADLFEVRIDLIGDGWQGLARQLGKPWIACNRIADEGGGWRGSEPERIGELQKAVELGASIVDIELRARDLAEVVKSVKKRARCMISRHDLSGTPPIGAMRQVIHQQLEAGADLCKLVTTARRFEDNLTVLQLVRDFPETRIVAFAMGDLGHVSRVLGPLVGGDFIYAAIAEGRESASGQTTVRSLRQIYEMLGHGE